MDWKLSLIGLVLVVLVLGCSQNSGGGASGRVSVDVEANKIEDVGYSMNEVARHNSSVDCWIVLDGKVYDFTGFIALGKHGPGINFGCGKDATNLYNSKPAHSGKARELAEKYYIGVLKE